MVFNFNTSNKPNSSLVLFTAGMEGNLLQVANHPGQKGLLAPFEEAPTPGGSQRPRDLVMRWGALTVRGLHHLTALRHLHPPSRKISFLGTKMYSYHILK